MRRRMRRRMRRPMDLANRIGGNCAMRRAHADAVDGVLLLDKPLGLSSNTALQRARHLLRARKAGHTGTLDPKASGLLPLTFGEATKFSVGLLESHKVYRARIALGVRTDSGDSEGEVVEQREVEVTQERMQSVLREFLGSIRQVPPMHSALKRDGRPLYELARQGLEVEREAREIHIARLGLVEWDPRQPEIEVECSKGTYVRVLAQDIGASLGCGAHLAGLRRTRVGGLRVEDAVSLDELEAGTLEARRAVLRPLDSLLDGLPGVVLDETCARRFRHGQRIALEDLVPPQELAPEARLRVVDRNGQLMGLARVEDGCLAPQRLLTQSTNSEIEEVL
jgi:tRNA pseudouridine55 synthase